MAAAASALTNQKWSGSKRQNANDNKSSSCTNAQTERPRTSISRIESMRSFRHCASHENASLLFAADIADCISSELTTIGLIAALLSSWGATVYGGDPPPEGGLCYGADMIQIAHVLFWISLGWFFICVTSSLVIVADLHGVPQQFILEHLSNPKVRFIYQIPELSIIGGVLFLAAGFTCDFGERTGCAFLYIGMVAASLFVGAIGLLAFVLRQDRQRLNQNINQYEEDRALSQPDSVSDSRDSPAALGRSIIATWRDRLYFAASEDFETNNVYDDDGVG